MTKCLHGRLLHDGNRFLQNPRTCEPVLAGVCAAAETRERWLLQVNHIGGFSPGIGVHLDFARGVNNVWAVVIEQATTHT